LSKGWRRALALLLGASAAASAAACVPSEPFAPVAVRLRDGTPEILYIACRPKEVKVVKLVRPDPRRNWIEDSDPVVWQVSFDPAVTVGSIEVGVRPPGGVTDVPLEQPLDPSVRYEAFVVLRDGGDAHTGFVMDRLGDGRVRFEDKYVSSDDFERESTC